MQRLAPIVVSRICFEQVSVCCLLDTERKQIVLNRPRGENRRRTCNISAFFSYGWQIPGGGGTLTVKCPAVGTRVEGKCPAPGIIQINQATGFVHYIIDYCRFQRFNASFHFRTSAIDRS